MNTHADAIRVCEELGTTPSECAEAAERVDEWIQFLVDAQHMETSVELPGVDLAHRHQLVSGPDDQDYIVLDIGDEVIELVVVQPPVEAEDHTSVAFLERTAVTHGQFVLGGYKPQYAGNGEPIWAY